MPCQVLALTFLSVGTTQCGFFFFLRFFKGWPGFCADQWKQTVCQWISSQIYQICVCLVLKSLMWEQRRRGVSVHAALCTPPRGGAWSLNGLVSSRLDDSGRASRHTFFFFCCFFPSFFCLLFCFCLLSFKMCQKKAPHLGNKETEALATVGGLIKDVWSEPPPLQTCWVCVFVCVCKCVVVLLCNTLGFPLLFFFLKSPLLLTKKK